MILIGMFDSPYVRRVAISLAALGVGFEHRNWSVGKDAERIREFHPQGRVPVLVLDDGDALTESSLIVDWLDRLPGHEHALLPAADPARRDVLRLAALATGAVDKGIQLVYERVFRPAEMRYPPWMERCRAQSAASLAALDGECAQRGQSEWLVGGRLSQADIMLACASTYLADAVPMDLSGYPALQARVARYETLPLFQRFHLPFETPASH